MYQLHSTTQNKWNLKTNEHPIYASTIEENLKIATRIDDAYSTGVFARQREDHAAAVKTFTRVRKEHAALTTKYIEANKERDIARNAVDAGNHNNDVALKNFAIFVAADANANAFASELVASEAAVNAAAASVVPRGHGADQLIQNEARRARYITTLCHPSTEHFNLPGGGSLTIPFGESSVPFLKQLALADGQALTADQAKWLPFADELLRIEFRKMLAERKQETRDFEMGGSSFNARRVPPFVPSGADMETVLAARREGYANANRMKKAQLEALQSELAKQA